MNFAHFSDPCYPKSYFRNFNNFTIVMFYFCQWSTGPDICENSALAMILLGLTLLVPLWCYHEK